MNTPTRRIRNARLRYARSHAAARACILTARLRSKDIALRAVARAGDDAMLAADELRMERDAAHEECAALRDLLAVARSTLVAAQTLILEDAERIDTITAERDHARAIAVALEQIQSIDVSYIERQIAFSRQAFGPGPRTSGILDHITKEITEVRAAPDDVEEWIDLAILAIDGAWRCGGTPEQIIATFHAKLAKNESRTWPDWRTFPEGVAIEHVRSNVDTRVPMDSDRAPEVEG